MPHDVFISYSSQDKAVAMAVCGALEKSNIKCWIAPRDILPGMSYGAAIVRAIRESKALVLVFSSSAKKTSFVRREIERAGAMDIPIITFRIENVLPDQDTDLEYFLTAYQFLDAFEDFQGVHLRRLTETVRLLLSKNAHASTVPTHVEPPCVAEPTNLGFEGPVLAGIPLGWFNSVGYVYGVSAAFACEVVPRPGVEGGQCIRLSRKGAHSGEFGSLMQRCPAKHLIGKTVRFEGAIRSVRLERWAGLWLRLDGTTADLFFDNMHDRPILGSTPWTKYSIETKVVEDAHWINYGILLVGNGTIWADDISLKVRGKNGNWLSLERAN